MRKILWAVFILFILGSCNSQDQDYIFTVHTNFGDIKMILYDQTPKHKANFIKLATTGQYDSTNFYRIIKDFMIQGGDINAKTGHENDINYTIPSEFIDSLIHQRGAIAAARLSDQINPEKKSNGSQFYIVQGKIFSKEELTVDLQKVNAYLRNLSEVPGYENILVELDSIFRNQGNDAITKRMTALVPAMEDRFGTSFKQPMEEWRIKVYTTLGGAPHLDGGYTVFGRVIEGMEVVDNIANIPLDATGKPSQSTYIIISYEKIPKVEWNKKYGGRPY